MQLGGQFREHPARILRALVAVLLLVAGQIVLSTHTLAEDFRPAQKQDQDATDCDICRLAQRDHDVIQGDIPAQPVPQALHWHVVAENAVTTAKNRPFDAYTVRAPPLC